MKIFSFLLTISIIFLAAGCGRDDEPDLGKTDVVIRTGDSPSDLTSLIKALDPAGPFYTVFNSGVMFFAQNIDAATFKGGRKYLSGQGSTTWTIPNGTYRFWAIAHTNVYMEGVPYCGKVAGGNAITLSGGTMDLGNLTLTTDCSGFRTNTDSFSMAVCATGNMSSITSPLQSCTSVSGTSPSASTVWVKFMIPERDEFSGEERVPTNGPSATGIQSDCLGVTYPSGAATPTATVSVVPGLSTDSNHDYRIPYDINLYSSNACTTAGGWLGTYRFTKGLSFADGSTSDKVYSVSSVGGSAVSVTTNAKWMSSGGNGRLFIRTLP